MGCLELEEIYKFYKREGNIFKLLNKEEKRKLYKAILISPIWITIVFLVFRSTKFDKTTILYALICILSCCETIKESSEGLNSFRERINKQFKIKTESLEETVLFYRGILINQRLYNHYKIITKEQNELLVKILFEKSSEYKRDKVVTIGFIGTIVIAICKDISVEVIKKYVGLKTNFIITIFIFFIMLILFERKLSVNILDLYNYKSKKYKEIAFVIEHKLLYWEEYISEYQNNIIPRSILNR